VTSFLFPREITKLYHSETFEITSINPDAYIVGDIITFGSRERLQVTHVAGATITVKPAPTERQETLGRLLGRSPDEFIP
jgi:hypothetical protein